MAAQASWILPPNKPKRRSQCCLEGLRVQFYSLWCAAGGGWSEHALNELSLTLRFTSILHEVSSSNGLGTVWQHWLTWLSLRPDTHRESAVTTQTTHSVSLNTHTQSWELIMEFGLLNTVLNTITFSGLSLLLLLAFNELIWPWSKLQEYSPNHICITVSMLATISMLTNDRLDIMHICTLKIK